MTCKVVIAESFRVAAGGLEEMESQGKTISECLQEVVLKAPALRKLWFNPEGGLSKYVILTVNGENVSIQDAGRPVNDGDEIYPILLIGGG
jgi:molybdopterin converting factor small subunit